MSRKFKCYAASAKSAELKPFEYDPGALGDEQVEIAVSHCGVCHSDLSVLDNEWGFTAYPFVPGHEVVGTIVATGKQVKKVSAGERVGLGWMAGSCMYCSQCLSGNQHLCPRSEQTIVHRHGGFADRVRCHWAWAIPLPDALDPVKAGPLFCAGITVFNPIIQHNIKPTDRVGVIGIGGLGHLALQFLNKWGCEVTAFSSSLSKSDEIMELGAHHVVSTREKSALTAIASTLNFVLSTVNVNLDWQAFFDVLAPKGILHTVGIVPDPIAIPAFTLVAGQKSLSGSPLGSPATQEKMLQFCARHQIEPVIETFPMSKVNDAFAHLRAGKARYRIVLANDIG